MIHFSLNVAGQSTVANTLRTAATTGGKRVNHVTYQWAQGNVLSQFRRAYPPERPGQRYQRTFNLGRSWDIRINPASITIYNRMAYAGYVVGDGKGKGQAWMHRGRWWLARDVANAARPALKQMVMTELDHMFATGQIRR